jgi:hypothetical protein
VLLSTGPSTASTRSNGLNRRWFDSQALTSLRGRCHHAGRRITALDAVRSDRGAAETGSSSCGPERQRRETAYFGRAPPIGQGWRTVSPLNVIGQPCCRFATPATERCAGMPHLDIVSRRADRYHRSMPRRRSRRKGTPKRSERSTDNFETDQFDDPDWVWVGDRRMFVVGHTPGGAPFGCFEDEIGDLG